MLPSLNENNSFTIIKKPKIKSKYLKEKSSFTIKNKYKKEPNQLIKNNSFTINQKKSKKQINQLIKNYSFTLLQNKPKKEPKQFILDSGKRLKDYNNEFNINESRPKTERENPNNKEKEIIYLSFNEHKFKRLRKSKRTKDTYFTIKPVQNYIKVNRILHDKNKTNKYKNRYLQQINENNFQIKSEYYYVEAKDSKVPIIFEKTIKKIINNQPNKQFNNLDVEKKVLTILSKDKYNEIFPKQNLESLTSDKNEKQLKIIT